MALTKVDDRGLKTPIDLLDDEKIRLGTGNDLEIYHTGSQSRIENSGTGELRIQADDIQIVDKEANDFHIKCVHDGAVELYYDNSKKLDTTSYGTRTTGNHTVTGQLTLETDGQKAVFGAGNDLEIYHNGTNSYLDNNTGHLAIRTNVGSDVGSNIYLQPHDNEDGIVIVHDGAVELYHDNSKKFETASDGIKITGDGSNSNITTASGDLQLVNTDDDINLYAADDVGLYVQTNEAAIKCIGNGAVELYHDNTKKLETQSFGINVQGVNSYDAQIKIHGQPAISRSYWGYSNGYSGTLVGRTDSSVASTIFMGVDATGNSGSSFGGLGSEIVFRRDHIFTTPNAANNNFVTCMRFGRATSTEGAVAFTNGLMFGNDQADANILDDYEVGTYTPTISSGGSNLTYTVQAGRYIKIGRLVRYDFYMQINGGVSNGSMYEFNLPMTADASSSGRGHGNITYHNANDSNAGNIGTPQLYIGTSVAQGYLGGTQWSSTSGSAQSNRYFIGGGTFHTAS